MAIKISELPEASSVPDDAVVPVVIDGETKKAELAILGRSSTTVTSNFAQPAVNATVAVVVGSTGSFAVDSIQQIEGGGTYKVVSIADGTHATLRNLGYAGSAAPGATVTAPAKVVAGGLKGDPGIDGSPGASVANFRCDAWSEAPLTLSGIQTIDGQAGFDGMIVVPNGQADQKTNGPYVMHSGAWVRHTSFDSSGDFNARAIIQVTGGTQFGGRWAMLNGPDITLGSSNIKFKISARDSTSVPEGHFRRASGVGDGDDTYGTMPIEDEGGNILGLLAHKGKKLWGSLRVALVGGVLNLMRGDVVVIDDYPYNAVASVQSTTAATSSGSANVVVASIQDFKVRHGVCLPGAGADHGVPTATAPTLERVGTAGSAGLGYKICWLTRNLGHSIASSEITIANAPNTLMQGIGSGGNAFMIRCNFATTGTIADFANLPSKIDGVRMRAGLIGCVKNQVAPADNGIYDITIGTDGKIVATRRYVLAAQYENGRQVHVGAGATNKGKYFRQTSATVTTLGTDAITYEECSIKVRPYGFDADASTNANISNLSSVSTSMNGVTLLVNYIVLVKNQSTQSQNGLYICGTPSGGFVALTRLTTFDSSGEMLLGSVVRVKRGGDYNKLFMLTGAPTTVGTDPVVWQDFSSAISHGLVYRRVGAGAFVYIGAFNANPMQDTTGVVFDNFFEDRGGANETLSVPTEIPATPPAAKRNDCTRARITAISGTTVTLDQACATTVGSVFFLHDNALALEDAMASFGAGSTGGIVEFSKSATYPVYSDWKVRRSCQFKGRGFKDTTIRFGAPHGLWVQGGSVSAEGSSGDHAEFERLRFTSTSACMPSGGYFVAGSMVHEQGAMVMIQARCQFKHCYIENVYGNGIAVAGRVEENTNANVCEFHSVYVLTTTRGNGWVFTGSDSNVAGLYGCHGNSCNGDGFFDDSFLGLSFIKCHGSANDNATYHVNQGSAQSLLLGCYSESNQSPDRLGTNTIRLGGNPSNGAENDAGLAIINRQNLTSFQVSIGSPRVQYSIGDPNIDDLLDWLQQPTLTARNSLDHRRYVANNDTIRHVFTSALTVAWDWVGRNKFGSGRIEFPNGWFSNTSPDAANVQKHGTVNGGPTGANSGIYDVGWIYYDKSGGDFGYYVTARYALTTAVWAASTSYRVGQVIDGGDGFSYLVKSIANNAPSGLSGGTIPTWTGGDTTDNLVTWERWGALSATGNYIRIGRKTKVSGSLAFGTINAGTVSVLTETLTGAAVGDDVSVTPQSGNPGAGLMWCGYVTAADTVEIRLANPTGGNVVSSNRTWRVSVNKNAA